MVDKSVSVSVGVVWAVAQDPATVERAAQIARHVDYLLAQAGDLVRLARTELAGLVPGAETSAASIAEQVASERERLRPIVARLSALAAVDAARPDRRL